MSQVITLDSYDGLVDPKITLKPDAGGDPIGPVDGTGDEATYSFVLTAPDASATGNYTIKLRDGDDPTVIDTYYAQLPGDGFTVHATTEKSLAYQVEAANLTIDALSPGALAQLLGADITITQPIDSAGQIKLTRGMDYTYADNRALEFVDDKNQWPDLDAATVALVCWRDGANALSFTGTAPVPTGSSKKVRFELASADTQKLSRGEWRYGVQAVISTRTIDLVRPGKSLSVVQFN